MKLKDSDLIHEYNATKRLGNPDTPASEDAKQLRENMHNTDNASFNVCTWDEAITNSLNNLKKMTVEHSVPENLIPEATKQTMIQLQNIDIKTTGYKQMLDGFCDTLSIAEDIFTEEEIAKAFIQALENQRQFYENKERFYGNLKTTIKFKLNEN
jgi:hypothetical protein